MGGPSSSVEPCSTEISRDIRSAFADQGQPTAVPTWTSMIQTLEWTDRGVRFLDQTKLPTEEVYVNCTTHQEVADVIRNMVVRGAPALGVAAGMGIALGVKNSKAENG